MNDTPPGPRGDPVFGSSRQYADDPTAFLEGVERAYDGIAAFDMGPMETYVVTEPALVERLLVSDAAEFRKPEFQADAIDDLLGDGLLLSEGESWREQRGRANPAFSMARVAGFDADIAAHAADRVDDWPVGDTVDVEAAMTHITLDVILDVMLGVSLPEARVDAIGDALEPVGARFEPDPVRFAVPEWLPMPDDREYAAAVATLDDLVDDIVAAREGTASGGDGDDPMDLLSVLLRARDRGEQSLDRLRDEVMTTLLAGHDTTALTLTYTWFLLSEHPDVEARLHAELDGALDDGAQPTVAQLQDLDYLEWVLQESMRLYPPVYNVFRTPIEPVELAGSEVPAGAPIMLPQWAIHRSPDHWDDPEAFDPERWRPERRADRPRFAYFPFGGGPRHCIGKQLALLEAKLIVATVASDYRLRYEGDTPLSFVPSLTIHPEQEMRMRVEPR
ncbi:cytochrome P450 [Halobacterium salinarum]|uniref:Cytochrome P450 n=5 Tax=Halobacterium salinarum TaxID=2242 RepID=A0A510N4M0_HALSA|nr:cytochrome P450 [Halobacterium salinarum]MBB6089804.1 cytochrome P450 [Halobacterium salinarum]MDL0120519.1 cytochrome P450 [Halobacterium salinarum]MDL0126001.1 cytochrome P450 [Halobacterium salinarum]MDL0129599.1 cytochrome P450 [Halobacterium salinarum]MDL0136611.1 cytochrome P450 [Halobacterium salinarum]